MKSHIISFRDKIKYTQAVKDELGRNVELLIRDPLLAKYETALQDYLKSQGKGDWESKWKLVSRIGDDIRNKWNVIIYLPGHVMNPDDRGSLPIKPYFWNLHCITPDELDDKIEYIRFEDTPDRTTPFLTTLTTEKSKVHFITTVPDPLKPVERRHEGELQIFPGQVAIVVNISDSIKKNMKQILKKIKMDLLADYEENKRNRKSFMKRVNSLKNPSFAKYLRWYDWREEGFSYRIIASAEISKSAAEAIEYFRKNKRIDKANVKGEDAVEKGYKVIYEAIHHRKYNHGNLPAPTMEIYDCPEHGTGTEIPGTEIPCPKSCTYFVKWQKIFEKKHRVICGPQIFRK
jgi:hypothetical protein